MGQITGGRTNILLIIMLVVSAAAHCGILLVVRLTPVMGPPANSPASVQVMTNPTPQVQMNVPGISQQLPENDGKRLPEVDLPDVNSVPDRFAEALSEAPAATVPESPSPNTQKDPAAERTTQPPQHIRAAAIKRVKETPSGEQRSPAVTEGNFAASNSSHNEGGEEPVTASGAGLEQYLQEILKKIERNKHYPLQARSRRLEGKTTIGFQLLADGRIGAVAVVRQSGHSILDRAALQAVNRAAPFQPRMARLEREAMKLEIVLSFQLNKR